MRARNVIHDNLATDDCPVWRARYYTPLTPRAVRNEITAKAMEVHESKRASWIEARLTPLDKLLSEEEAAALEQYVRCEELLAGNARCGDYTGDRVMTSRGEMSPIPDNLLVILAAHAQCKDRLSQRDREVLFYHIAQMQIDGPSDAECAIRLGVIGGNRKRSWHLAVKDAASKLI